MEKISVFLSWSKDKSKEYAEITEKFLCNICDNKLSFFFSPDMEKGSHSNLEITEKLINCNKCLIFLTNENYKNPWAVFEAGVALGSKPLKNNTVIPVLFDTIPSWSSWIDNPLYPYTIINMTSSVSGKNDFKSFLNSFGIKICHSKFESEWEEYIKNILNVRKKY